MEATMGNQQETRRWKPRRHTGLFEDKKGRWWIDIYVDGQRRRKLCGSFEAAKAARREIERARQRGNYVDENSAPTFAEYSRYYLETVSTHKDSHDRERRLMKNLVEYFGKKRLPKIKRKAVVGYRKGRLERVSGATVNREVALLRHMFNVAIDEGVVAVNPAKGGPGLKAFKERRRMRYLEKSEVEQLLAAIQSRIAKTSGSALKAWQYLHSAVVIALHTGMRKGEILGLRWEQINWEKRHILLTVTKNDEARRVPIDSILLHELADHRQRVDHPGLVFPSYDLDGNVVPIRDVKVGFGRALRDAGIKDFRFHDLRHTFASHYMMGGGKLYTLAKILGHKDIKMTQRYADLSPDYIDRERERLDTIWTPAPVGEAGHVGAGVSKYLQ